MLKRALIEDHNLKKVWFYIAVAAVIDVTFTGNIWHSIIDQPLATNLNQVIEYL